MKLPANYEYGDISGSIMQHLSLLELPSEITLGSTLYKSLPKHHCTIVTVRKLIPKLVESDRLSPEEAETRLEDVVEKVFAQLKPHIGNYLPDVRVVTVPEDGKQTIAILARGEGFDEFFAELSRRLRIDIPVQPAHVTICSINGRPIGLNSQSHLRDRTRGLTKDELTDWNKQIDTKKIFGVEI